MSGHSKWHSIKHKKGVLDAKRGKIFTKLAKNITVAARLGGGDLAMNPSLKLAVEKAKAANMPNVNIDRAIKSGTGEGKDGVEIHEMIYEGYGPCGVALMVRTLTDNKNRTVTNLRTIFNKNGGSLGDSGAVAYQFARKGLVEARFVSMNVENAELIALEGDGEQVRQLDEQTFAFISEPEAVSTMKPTIEQNEGTITDVSIVFEPQITVDITSVEDAQKLLHFIDLVDDDDDVDAVFGNFVIPDHILDAL